MKLSSLRRRFVSRRFALALFSLVAAAGLATSARAAEVYVPNGADSATSGTNSAALLNSGARTFQFALSSDMLSGVGTSLTGLSFRLAGGAASSLPATDLTATDLEIRVGTLAVDINAMGGTFATNLSNATLVRDGAYTLTAGLLPGDGSDPAAFAPLFTFDTPYTYTDGTSLVIEIRHTGFGSNIALDSMALGSEDSLYRAFQGGSFSATNGSAVAFPALVLTFSAIPEPSTYAALAGASMLGLALLRRRRSPAVSAQL